MPQNVNPTDITATINPPADQHGGDWDWADDATQAWCLAAGTAGLRSNIVSFEVPGLNHDAAIVEIDGVEYVLEVRDREVSAIPRHTTWIAR